MREAGTLVRDRFCVGVDAGLSPLEHLVARLLRTGDLAALLQLAEWESKLRVQAQLRSTRWDDGGLVLDVAGVLVDGADKPVELADRNGTRVLTPPLPSDIVESLPPDLLNIGDRTVSLDLFARQTGTGTQQFLSGSHTAEDGSGLAAASMSCVPVDARSGDAEPLADGIWEIFARWRAFGWTFSPPVSVQAPTPGGEDLLGGPALIGSAPRLATPHRSSRGNLRVELTGASPAIPTTVPKLRVDRDRSTASVQGGAIALDLALRLETDRSRHVTVEVAQGSSEPAEAWPGVLDPVDTGKGVPSRCRLTVTVAEGALVPGRWKLRLSPDDAAYRLPVACPLTVRENGSVRLGRNPPHSRRAWALSLLPAGVVRRLKALRNASAAPRRSGPPVEDAAQRGASAAAPSAVCQGRPPSLISPTA